MIDPQLIRRSHLFSGLTDADVALLAAIIQVRKYSRGQPLFAEGEEAGGFYLVCCGKVKIYKLSTEGRERVLHVVTPGQTFADAAIFDQGSYPAFADTLTEAELYFFPKKEFLNLLGTQGQLAINMIAGLSRYLRQFTVQIEDLTFRDVPARLARYLLELSGHAAAVVLPVSKSQLASHLGTTGETLSRTLRKLADEGLISVQGRTIQLLAPELLTDLSQSSRGD